MAPSRSLLSLKRRSHDKGQTQHSGYSHSFLTSVNFTGSRTGINLKVAKQLGITIPPEVLYQATKVIK